MSRVSEDQVRSNESGRSAFRYSPAAFSVPLEEVLRACPCFSGWGSGQSRRDGRRSSVLLPPSIEARQSSSTVPESHGDHAQHTPHARKRSSAFGKFLRVRTDPPMRGVHKERPRSRSRGKVNLRDSYNYRRHPLPRQPLKPVLNRKPRRARRRGAGSSGI